MGQAGEDEDTRREATARHGIESEGGMARRSRAALGAALASQAAGRAAGN